MRTANGGEDNEEVNGDLQSESNELAWVNEYSQNSNHSSGSSIINDNNYNNLEENLNNNNDDFIENINGDPNNNGEENNNDIQIEVNNNYQALDNIAPAVSRRYCTGNLCECSEINEILDRAHRLDSKPYHPFCHCLQDPTWNAEEQCCYFRNLAEIVQVERKFIPRNSDQEESDIEIINPDSPSPAKPGKLLGKRPTADETEQTQTPAKRPKKAFAKLSLSSLTKQPEVLQPRSAIKRQSEDKENTSDVRVKRTKTKASTDLCFVSCNSPVVIDDSPPSDPLAVTAPKTGGKRSVGGPLKNLSLTSREQQRRAADKMYEPPALHQQIAATSFYNSKLSSHDDQNGGIGTSSTNSGANSSSSNQNLLDSNKTIATLCNIGNSCYLNSVVYTLRFAPMFLHKLHHLIEDMATIYIKLNPTKHKSSSLGRNVSLWQGNSGRSWSSKDLASLGSISNSDGLPRNNRLIVTEKLHELYQNLHKNESTLNSEPLHAGAFLQAIQEVCSIFEGNQQQDAHECLMCILDSICETCDTLATAIIDNPEQLLSEYGYGGLIEEAKDELTPLSGDNGSNNTTATATTGTTTTSSSTSSNKITKKLFSRNSKRKKSDDDRVPDSPSKDTKENCAGTDTETPLSPTEVKNNTRNMILKALAGDNDVNDRKKLKENVCKLLGLNFFREDFEGVTVASIKCLSCETVRRCEEKMIDVSVAITAHENPESMANPQVFFQNSLITKEYFRGEYKYRCEECSGYTEAIRSVSYEKLPRLLVIHLKRFSGGMEKINSYIPTPFTLQCFCNRCLELPDDEKLHTYKLYSVITHVGATMSVGHYVAYTCSLDIQNEYRFCPNERTKLPLLVSGGTTSVNGQNGDNDKNASRSGSNGSQAASSDKNPRSLKRFLFGGKKANSSGDISKNFKTVNGLVTKAVANGIEKLSLSSGIGSGNGSSSSASCQGSKCCGIHVKNSKLMSNNGNGSFVSYLNGHLNGETLSPPAIGKPSSSDMSLGSTHSNTSAGHASNHLDEVNGGIRRPNINQDYWYMCDDDKIKVMPQAQFEEYLSPNRKNMITPYLLFYARYDQNQS